MINKIEKEQVTINIKLDYFLQAKLLKYKQRNILKRWQMLA